MDRVAREDIAAAAAARSELGSGYDDVIAESLIDRIGAEIDKRIDAKLGRQRRTRRTDIAELERRRTLWRGAAVGAAAVGVPVAWAATASHDASMAKGVVVLVFLVWAVIATGYGVARWVHMQRRNDD